MVKRPTKVKGIQGRNVLKPKDLTGDSRLWIGCYSFVVMVHCIRSGVSGESKKKFPRLPGYGIRSM